MIAIVLCLKNSELSNSYSAKVAIATKTLIDEIKPRNEMLFNLIYVEVTEWVNSGSYDNYLFFINLNNKVQKIGYPIEENWSS